MKISKSKIHASSAIMAADPNEFIDIEDEEDDVDDELDDTIDDIQDSVDDLQDSVEDIAEDDPSIEIDNNITDHYIAECERCHGIFISAVVESDQEVESITGTCPLCDRETTQYLKWVVKDAE